MANKLKSYTVTSKGPRGGRCVDTVHARSKDEARRVAERKYNYKNNSFTVKGPY